MIESVKERVESGEYRLTVHAFERCVERNISPEVSQELFERIKNREYVEETLKIPVLDSAYG